MLQIPIAYIIFNRPDHTRKSFEVIRAQKPSKLYVIADGPRSNFPSELERCFQVRKIIEDIDWPCEVLKNYSNENLGLKERISSGLDWVFSFEEKVIILEDDCIANEDFFIFCEELLNLYAKDERVSMITGNNFQNGVRRGNASYYFSKYNHCWGWATWRRSWLLYQRDINFWPDWKQTEKWKNKFDDLNEYQIWTNLFNAVHKGEINSWAYPWLACLWFKGGLTATPNVNLVSNIGFGDDSTHTLLANSPLANIPSNKLGIIVHPTNVVQNKRADKYVFHNLFGGKNFKFPRVLFFYLKKYIKSIYIKK